MATIVPHKGKWRVVVRRTGYPYRSKVCDTHKDAEKWAREIEGAMDKRTYLAPSGEKGCSVFERFRDEVCPLRGGGRWEQVRINRLLRTCAWLNKPVDELDRFDIQAWRDQRLKEVAPSSVNRELNLISGILRHAMQEWGVALRVNPVHEIKRPPKGKPRRRRIEANEQAALDEVFRFDETKTPREGYGAVRDSIPWVFHLARETGMRSGELLDLEWKHVQLDRHWLRVSKSKNGDEREVPLTERAEDLLRKLLPEKPVGRVFPINKGSFEVTYRRLRDKAGTDLHFHDTRHEAASSLAKSLNPLELSKTLGHRDPRTTMIYYNPTPEELALKLRGRKKT